MGTQIDKGALKSHQAHEQNMLNILNEIDERFFTLRNKDCVEYLMNIRTLEILKPL